jgi:predicted RNA-binding Zn ribbon-like protein
MTKLARRGKVPDELANVYEFVNSLDVRRFIQKGVPHEPDDALASARGLAAWMSERGLLAPDATITPSMLETARLLRSSLRAYLQCDATARRRNEDVLRALSRITRLFPLAAEAGDGDGMRLRPVRSDAVAGLSQVVADLYNASVSRTLDRLKMCAAEDCHWVYFDRSKPGSRRWCSSVLCGNRQKTRAYRERRQGAR